MGHGEEVVEQLNPDCVASMDCLPDELLIQILSFLPTKQAASTSVLSKRWRNLFAFSHNLDFGDPIFFPFAINQREIRDMRKSFRDFVYRTLALQGGNNIKKLSLTFNDTFDLRGLDVIKYWIYYALKHGISELQLRINPIAHVDFLSGVFTGTTLVKLSLGTGFYIHSFPQNISLPSLKVLLLDSVRFWDDLLSDVFLAACPVLEDLTIVQMYYGDVSYNISSKTIKRLSFTYNLENYGYDSSIISLDTPNIFELYYSDCVRQKYPHCNLDLLVKATLDLYFLNNYERSKQNDVMYLISGIRNVKTLHLTFSAVEVISVCCKGELPVFNNLVKLVFSSKKRGWIKLLPLLLERSPNLQNLVLSGLNCYTFNRKHRFVGTRIPPNNQIKMLSIMQYEGSENELNHISHFLLKMESLEVVKVYLASAVDDPKKMQATEDLLKLPTASSKLEIQIM